MPEAVIVATSRTPIGRANKGSLVDARPDDMSAFILSDVMGKAGVEAADVEDVIWGIGQPGGEGDEERRETGRTIGHGDLLGGARTDRAGRARSGGRGQAGTLWTRGKWSFT